VRSEGVITLASEGGRGGAPFDNEVNHSLRNWSRCVVELRRELSARKRKGAAGDSLEQYNTILSMVIGSEYPLAGTRRDSVQKARHELDWLPGHTL
jgi:hypothetical protein